MKHNSLVEGPQQSVVAGYNDELLSYTLELLNQVLLPLLVSKMMSSYLQKIFAFMY